MMVSIYKLYYGIDCSYEVYVFTRFLRDVGSECKMVEARRYGTHRETVYLLPSVSSNTFLLSFIAMEKLQHSLRTQVEQHSI